MIQEPVFEDRYAVVTPDVAANVLAEVVFYPVFIVAVLLEVIDIIA